MKSAFMALWIACSSTGFSETWVGEAREGGSRVGVIPSWVWWISAIISEGWGVDALADVSADCSHREQGGQPLSPGSLSCPQIAATLLEPAASPTEADGLSASAC